MNRLLGLGASALTAMTCLAAPAGAQNLGTFLSIFNLGQFLSNDNPEATFNASGGDSSTSGTFNGRAITISAVDGTTVDQVPGRQTIRLSVDGEEVTITTDAASSGPRAPARPRGSRARSTASRSMRRSRGNLQSIPDSSRTSGSLNGESIVIVLPEGVTFRQLSSGNTQVDLTLDGKYLGEFSIFVNQELVFSGTIEELEDDALSGLLLANAFNLLNP